MRQQKETQYCGIGNLVVKGLAMQVEKGRVDPNVITTTGSQTLQLPEDADGISSGLNYICLRQHILGKGLQKYTLIIRLQIRGQTTKAYSALSAPMQLEKASPQQDPHHPPGWEGHRSAPP